MHLECKVAWKKGTMPGEWTKQLLFQSKKAKGKVTNVSVHKQELEIKVNMVIVEGFLCCMYLGKHTLKL